MDRALGDGDGDASAADGDGRVLGIADGADGADVAGLGSTGAQPTATATAMEAMAIARDRPARMRTGQLQSMRASETGSVTPFRAVGVGGPARTSPASSSVSVVAMISPPVASPATLAATWTPLPL